MNMKSMILGISLSLLATPPFAEGSFSTFESLPSKTRSKTHMDKVKVKSKLIVPPSDEYRDLLRRQANLLANNEALSTLRVQYAHAQLWLMFNDTEFVYWNHELKRLLVQFEQINTASVSTAIQSLVEFAVNLPEAAPCSYFDSNSLECKIANVQSINNWLQKRNHQIFSSTGASSWFADWTNHWQQTLVITEGYIGLKQDMDQFLANNPDLPVYFQLQQDFSAKSNELLADPGVSAKVNDFAQQYTSDLQNILNTTDYNAQLTHHNERSKTLLETNPDYLLLQQESVQLAKSLENQMLAIHTAIENCKGWGYGNHCFDPEFNYFLQSLLPQYSSAANEVLINNARFTEKSNQFWHNISQDPAVQALQKESADILKATLEPILPELQDVQETYLERVFSIEFIREKMVDMWNQLQEIEQQLGFIQQ